MNLQPSSRPFCIIQPFKAWIAAIIDGDTVECEFESPFRSDDPWVICTIRVRLSGCDTPERHPKRSDLSHRDLEKHAAENVTKAVTVLLPIGAKIWVIPRPDPTRNGTTFCPFGRLLADIQFSDDRRSLVDHHLQNGWARPTSTSTLEWTSEELNDIVLKTSSFLQKK